jgi:hypothetical protein
MTTMTRSTAPLLASLLLLAPAAAFAQARVIQFRSAEDPASPPDPKVCANAPFAANLRIGGSLYAHATRASDGRVVNDDSRAIGKATACAQITNLAFPAGLQQKFYLQLTLADGIYTASGTCTILSNDVPQGGLVLAGCGLHVLGAPDGVIGGAVSSLSTFNPFRLQGFATGSYWTVQLYDVASSHENHQDSARAMEWTDGGDNDFTK